MCLSVELHQKAEDSGGFDQDVSPDSEELDLEFSEDTPSGVVRALVCLGGEHGAFLSHAGWSLTTRSGLQGADDVWHIIPALQNCTFTITCLDRGVKLYLAHYDGEVYLTPSAGNLSDLQWYVEKQSDGYTICCYSRGSRMYLSHSFGRVFLQWAYRGAGELWKFD